MCLKAAPGHGRQKISGIEYFPLLLFNHNSQRPQKCGQNVRIWISEQRPHGLAIRFGTRFSAEKQPRLAQKSAKLSLGGRGCIVNIDYDVLGHRTHNVRVRGDVRVPTAFRRCSDGVPTAFRQQFGGGVPTANFHSRQNKL